MNKKDACTPAGIQGSVANIDWAALLSPEEIDNLAGFFDTLIEMDFEIKRQQGEKNDTTNKGTDGDKPPVG